MRRRAWAVLLGVLLPVVVVLGASPASAMPASDPFTSFCSSPSSAAAADLVPLGAAGGLATGEEATGAVLSGVAVDVAAPVLFAAASYCATTAVLHWVWGGSHTVEAATAPSTSTTFGAGCWNVIPSDGSPGGCLSRPWSGTRVYDSQTTVVGGFSWTATVTDAVTSHGDTQVAFTVTTNSSPTAWSPTAGGGQEVVCVSWATGATTYSAWTRSTSGSVTTFTASCATGSTPTVAYLQKPTPAPGSWAWAYEFSTYGRVTTYGTDPAAPDHKLRFVTTCKAADGSTSTSTAYSVTFKESDGALPPIELAPCASGSVPVQRTTFEGDASGAGGPALFDWNSPDPLTSPYPECLPGGVQVPCILRLVQRPVTGGERVCGTEADCTAYEVQPDGSTRTTVVIGTDTYACLWGSYAMPLVQCDAMGAAAEGIATAPADTGTGDTASGSPLLGLPPAGSPGAQCFPSGWGLLNPLSWVYMPVMCALRDAFEPSPSTLTDAGASLSDAYNGSALATVASGVSSVVGGVGGVVSSAGSSDCQGPQLPAVPTVGLGDPSYPLSACDPPMSTWAAFSRVLLGFVVAIGGGMLSCQIVGSAFGIRMPWKSPDPPEQLEMF